MPRPNSEDALEMHAIVRGNVQGVFFRRTTKDIATRLKLKGTVTNLSDGSVEIYAQGTQDHLHLLIERLQEEFDLDPENSVSMTFSEPKEFYEDFQVIA